MPKPRNEHEAKARSFAVGLLMDAYHGPDESPLPRLKERAATLVAAIIDAARDEATHKVTAQGHQPTKTPINPKPPKSGTGVKKSASEIYAHFQRQPKNETGVKRDCCAYHRSGGPLPSGCGNDRHRPGEGAKRSAAETYAHFQREPGETDSQLAARIKAFRNDAFNRGFAQGWREAIMWAKEQADDWPEEVATD